MFLRHTDMKSIKTAVVTTMIAALGSGLMLAQSSMDSLLPQLQDLNVKVRISAFYQLPRIDSAASDQVKVALINLLAVENAYEKSDAFSISDDQGEAYGTYRGDLVDVVASLKDPRAINALIDVIDSGSTAMDAIASFGIAGLAPVIRKLADADPTVRNGAALVLQKLIAESVITAPADQVALKVALNKSATDEDYFVKLSSIEGLLLLNRIPVQGGFNLVTIDIKPGGTPNAINVANRGLIPVAILSTRNFDATSIDPASLKFGSGQTTPVSGLHIQDVNRDGIPDAVVQFDTLASQLTCSDTGSFVIGKTINGEAILGADSVVTLGCK